MNDWMNQGLVLDAKLRAPLAPGLVIMAFVFHKVVRVQVTLPRTVCSCPS